MKTITLNNFPQWATRVAYPAKPDVKSPAAMKRMMAEIADYVYIVKGVRPQFKAHNSCVEMDFENDKDRAFYDSALERLLEQRAKYENSGLANANIILMVEQLKFRMAAELIKANALAKLHWEDGTKTGQTVAVGAYNFKGSIAKVVNRLYMDYNIKRDDISLIWGGSKSFTKAGQDEFTPAKIQEILRAATTGGYIDDKLMKRLLKHMTLKSEDLGDLPAELDLGPQSKEERQREIDKYQSGQARFGFYTFKSGGVGLSLHHNDEWMYKLHGIKVRRKKDSNYAYVEDIPLITNSKPRITRLGPTYSPIEMVQGLGRAPRLTSLSDTYQYVHFFRNTVETDVMAIVSRGFQCLRQVVQQPTDWESVIWDRGAKRRELERMGQWKDEDDSEAWKLDGAIEDDEDEGEE